MKNRLVFIPAFVIVFTLFMVGTFLDLEISKAVCVTTSTWPRVIAGFANLPICLVLAFVGGNLIKIITEARYSKVHQNILLGFYALVLIGFSTWLFGDTMVSYHAFNLKRIYVVPLGLIVSLIGTVLGYKFFKYVDTKDYVKLSLYLVITCVVAFCIVFGFKLIAPRARFTSIERMVHGEELYRPWYKPDLTKEVIAMLKDFNREEAESFPSGHSASAMLILIILSNLPLFIKKLKGKEALLFYIGFVYYLFIGFARFYRGAHFISDITFAGLVVLMIYFISNEIYLLKIKGVTK